MKATSLFMVLVLGIVPVSLRAESPASSSDTQAPKLKTLTEKRAWLQREAIRGVRDPQQAQALIARINNLKPKEVDVLLNSVLAQQLPPAADARDRAMQRQAEWELQRAIALRQALEREYWRRNGRGVGYMPVITWLPEGTSMGAMASISPDGRYVRTTTQPFFSSVGPVYTYNINTGETRLMPQYRNPYGYYPNTGYPYNNHAQRTQTRRQQYPLGYPTDYSGYRSGQMPAQHLPPKAPSHQPNKVWYDGMRTRVSR